MDTIAHQLGGKDQRYPTAEACLHLQKSHHQFTFTRKDLPYLDLIDLTKPRWRAKGRPAVPPLFCAAGSSGRVEDILE